MSDHQLSVFQSGIRDNRNRRTVGDFLKDKIELGSKLSIVSAYFTIYAFEALKYELSSNCCIFPNHKKFSPGDAINKKM